MLQSFFTAKSKVMGERAATQIGGWGFCTGLGNEVARHTLEMVQMAEEGGFTIAWAA
jgi:hypothetical protein